MLVDLRPVVITVCVAYWDYLRVTLPHTLRFASAVYIVTTPHEPAELPTSSVSTTSVSTTSVSTTSVHIVRTDAFFHGGAVFNKAAAIRETQLMVHARHPEKWILLLDADVLVDSDAGFGIDDPEALYGITRMDYQTPNDLEADQGVPYHTVGAGYFQLYFDKSKLYPEFSHDASECDMTFYNSFSKQRTLGGIVKHIGIHTVNWTGRSSPPWLPELR